MIRITRPLFRSPLRVAIAGVIMLATGSGIAWAATGVAQTTNPARSSTAAAASAATPSPATSQSAQSTGTSSTMKDSKPSSGPSGAKSSSAAQQSPSTQTTSSQPPKQTTAAGSALRGMALYVDPARAGLPSPLNTAPVASWFGDWTPDVRSSVNTLVSNATATGSVATIVAYDIPGRDCGSYSAGGASGSDAYRAWIRNLAGGIGNRHAIVILEPDALAQITCLDAAGQASRYSLLNDAVSVLTSQTAASVYIDAGHSNWIGSAEMANRLSKAGIGGAAGFSLNVSNFHTTANNVAYGNAISAATNGKHFVIDTSRNGNGPGSTWCNPRGRALGETPTTTTSGNVDAYLWIKPPGESDGTCNGGPSAGAYWAEYANELIANRR